MSRKSVPFAMPGGSGRSAGPRSTTEIIDAHSDEWVSDRNHGEATPRASAGLLIDLGAERGLAEIVALSLLVPAALWWFWSMNAMNGRVRF